MLTGMHYPPAEGNFCGDNGNAPKPTTVEDYNRHMGYVDRGDRMALSAATHGSGQKLLDLTVLNSYIYFLLLW
jgi:hypothetical protein